MVDVSLAIVRVPRGAPPPSAKDLRAALATDREELELEPTPGSELVVTGPYAVVVDGKEVDEYVAWER